MNPYYYRALKQANKCNEKNIKISVEFINSYTDETLNHEEIQEVKDNLERLNKFIEYAGEPDAFKYKNVFEILNIGENSISRFIEWCLNVEEKDPEKRTPRGNKIRCLQ